MIKLENVNFKYKNEKDVLKDINLEIKEGEFISIIGKNGSREVHSSQNNVWIRNPKQGACFNR